LGIFVFSLPYFFGGYSGMDFEVGDIFGDNGAGGNNGSVSDFYIRENGDSGANENMISDFNRFDDRFEIFRVDVVFGVVDKDLRGDVGMRTNFQFGTTVKEGVVADDGSLSDRDILGIKKMSSAVNSGFFTDFYSPAS